MFTTNMRQSDAIPQSFNRYAYVQNDPVNFVDPLGLCSFDIAIAGHNYLSDRQNQGMRNEISRIFGTAGRGVNFVSIASGPDYTLNISPNAGSNVSRTAVGSTVIGDDEGSVYIDRLTASATSDARSETAFNQSSTALGVGLGRAGSHEIGHYLLSQWYDSSKIQGVMHAGFNGNQWFATTTQNLWTFNAQQQLQLLIKCFQLRAGDAPLSATPQSPGTDIVPRSGGGGGGGGRGGNYFSPYPNNPFNGFQYWEFYFRGPTGTVTVGDFIPTKIYSK